MTLGQRIQEHRARLGLSQEGLGERLGVSRQAVSKWEADGAVPETDKLIALSRLFGISLNDLLAVDGPEPVRQARRRLNRRTLCRVLAVALAGAALLLLGLQQRRIGALETRVDSLEAARQAAPLSPADLVAGWELSELGQDWIRVELTLSYYDPSAGTQVFLQAAGTGFDPVRVEAEELTGGYCSVLLELPQFAAPFTLSVVFLTDGVEQIQPLARFDAISGTGASWEPLWTREG